MKASDLTQAFIATEAAHLLARMVPWSGATAGEDTDRGTTIETVFGQISVYVQSPPEGHVHVEFWRPPAEGGLNICVVRRHFVRQLSASNRFALFEVMMQEVVTTYFNRFMPDMCEREREERWSQYQGVEPPKKNRSASV